MGTAIILIAWAVVNIWASSIIKGRGLPRTAQRMYFYALIWLLPFFGAAIAIYVTGLGLERKKSSPDDAMFQAFLEKHRSMQDD